VAFDGPNSVFASVPKLTYTSFESMLADWNELAMIAAHCLLTGFDVGAIKVIEKSGEEAATTG